MFYHINIFYFLKKNPKRVKLMIDFNGLKGDRYFIILVHKEFLFCGKDVENEGLSATLPSVCLLIYVFKWKIN